VVGRLQDVKCYPWKYGSFCLIGDAAHAIFPHYGQGLNASLEDCMFIDTLIDKHSGNWEAITDEFQTIRKPNTDAVSDLSKEHF